MKSFFQKAQSLNSGGSEWVNDAANSCNKFSMSTLSSQCRFKDLYDYDCVCFFVQEIFDLVISFDFESFGSLTFV